MDIKYREALYLLEEKLKFQVNTITPLDVFYNDGDIRVRDGFFRLIFTREKDKTTVVYIYEGGFWVSYGELTEEERRIIQTWINERA